MNFREWTEFEVPEYYRELKKKKKVVKFTKGTDGPNPFFELGYISVKKLKALRDLFDYHKSDEKEVIPRDGMEVDAAVAQVLLNGGGVMTKQEIADFLRELYTFFNVPEKGGKRVVRFGDFCSLWAVT